MKYIKLHSGFITFPESIRHDTIVQSGQVIKSAGFVKHVNGELFCVGEPTSLGIGSLPEDTQELREWLGVTAPTYRALSMNEQIALQQEVTQLTALLALADARAELHQETSAQAIQHDVLDGVVNYLVDELGHDHIAGLIATSMPRKY